MKRDPLATMSADALRQERAELANRINPLWLRLDAIDDELMSRQREERRQRVLTDPSVDHG